MDEEIKRGMKAKTIRKILRKLVDSWLESIEDPAIKQMASVNTIVTGGCIASMLLAEPINDFDLYFRNRDTAVAIAKYYVERFKPTSAKGIHCSIKVDDYTSSDRVRIVVKSAGIASEDGAESDYNYFEGRPSEEAETYIAEVMGDPGRIEEAYEETETAALQVKDNKDGKKFRPIFMSTNAITLSNRLQIVLRFFGEPDEIHSNYDYVHCTNYWCSWNGELVLRPDALESLLTRELRYVGSKYPLCSIIRLRKFIKRGWVINAGQILKAVMQLNELNLKSMPVLRDQLTGVDAAYFVQLMAQVQEKNPETVDTAYLVEIIDRMF